MFVYSGKDGSVLFEKAGGPDEGFGDAVSGAGDLNGDGKADFIVGADDAVLGGFENAGSAYVYSGADGSVLAEKHGSITDESLGITVSGGSDLVVMLGWRKVYVYISK